MDEQYNTLIIDLFRKPRTSFNRIINEKLDRYKIWLLALVGISSLLGNAISKHIGDNFGIIGILLYIIVLGPIIGIILMYLLSYFISLTGKWLKGNATTNTIVNIISYATIPLTLGIIIDILNIILFGSIIFTKGFNIHDYNTLLNIVYFLGILINFALLVEYCILVVIGISVLQGFSIAKSIFNIFLSCFVILIPLMIIIFIIGKLR